MKKIGLSLLAGVAVAALTAPDAAAQDFEHRYYGTLFGGVNWLEDSALFLSGANLSTGSIGFETGYLFGGALGLLLSPNVRAEFELSYRRNGISSLFEGGASVPVQGGDHADAYALMANLWYDHPLHDGWSLHVGGGLGAARVGLEIADINQSGPIAPIDDSDWVFAGQVGGGIDYTLANGQMISLDYRLFLTADPIFGGIDSGSNPFTASHDYTAHSLIFSWRAPLNGQ